MINPKPLQNLPFTNQLFVYCCNNLQSRKLEHRKYNHFYGICLLFIFIKLHFDFRPLSLNFSFDKMVYKIYMKAICLLPMHVIQLETLNSYDNRHHTTYRINAQLINTQAQELGRLGGYSPPNILGRLFIILRELRMREIYVNFEPHTCVERLSDETGQRHTNVSPKFWL